MTVKRTKKDIRIEINDILDKHCVPCEIKTEFTRRYGNATGHLANYCKDECSVGKKLIRLGRKLDSSRRKKYALKKSTK